MLPTWFDPKSVQVPGDAININVFRNLESPVSEGGENFSAGALCMVRVAILNRAKVLLIDEA
ncbi:hypothetical protein L226DRAFT_566742 [Lentinus tigrinus ALCF2SS1-7]|uniref:Uncharacterized protein n=1 Tax=Lentinus tigrinus ALCF2SS1-6 TaxID=1328759 RepID=A0A5C2SR31_9APHY|nr:hypothetical protein L227DRAFT_606406 [Lentinus tigrinus ALCF2SS1-6]RPD80224.1 hypothetical protein L226DRAFT_566742 [Lentinus tigrinus ALCF2SS1-7]